MHTSPRYKDSFGAIRAAAAGAFIDRMIETKGLDAIDRHRALQHGELPVDMRKFQRLTTMRS